MTSDTQNRAESAPHEPTILIIDDDPLNLSIVTNYLEEYKFTILVAEDGEIGVTRAGYARPDLILLDIMMPGVDGYETCRKLKSQDSTRDIPVIFMTALAETGHKVRGFEAGAVDYITKPFQREEVLARVGVHLRIRELTTRLQEANETLEKRVEERTTELQLANNELQTEIIERRQAEEERVRLERELRQAQKMEAIGTLAAGIAHDFNNILTAILGFTQLALNKLPPENPVKRDMERVLESSLRAAELVRQILSFSRQSELKRKPVQVSLIVDEVLKLLRSSLPATIEIRQDNALPRSRDNVLADATQIHQVLMNLGTNAAHAMRIHGGILSVGMAEIEADDIFVFRYPDLSPGPYVRFEISDTGHGMDAATIERIFDPYFTTKEIGEGTGMGLAVVQGIIKSHGGAITVSSEPGKGTFFHIFLPLIRDEIVQEVKPPEPLIRGSEHILFVDDEQALAELGQEMLQCLGYKVTATTSSLDALKSFRDAPGTYDLVITDLTMPGLTGKKLARELVEIRSNIPIILCTGFSEFINRKQARETGIREILMKPYVINSLATTIREVLDQNNATQ